MQKKPSQRSQPRLPKTLPLRKETLKILRTEQLLQVCGALGGDDPWEPPVSVGCTGIDNG